MHKNFYILLNEAKHLNSLSWHSLKVTVSASAIMPFLGGSNLQYEQGDIAESYKGNLVYESLVYPKQNSMPLIKKALKYHCINYILIGIIIGKTVTSTTKHYCHPTQEFNHNFKSTQHKFAWDFCESSPRNWNQAAIWSWCHLKLDDWLWSNRLCSS